MNLPPYNIYPIIPDDRISLRQILPLDIADIVEISFYNSVQATTINEAAVMQKKIEQDYRDGNSLH